MRVTALHGHGLQYYLTLPNFPHLGSCLRSRVFGLVSTNVTASILYRGFFVSQPHSHTDRPIETSTQAPT